MNAQGENSEEMEKMFQEAMSLSQPTLSEEYNFNEEYKFSEENKYFDEDGLSQKINQLMEEMKLSDAVLALEAGLTMDNKNANMWKLLGTLKQESDEDDKAIICFKKALEFDPDDNETKLKLAVSYINNSNIPYSIRLVKDWLLSNNRYESLISKNTLKEEADSLITELTKCLKIDSTGSITNKDTQLLTALGVLSFTKSDFSKAAEYFQDAVLANSNDYGLWNKLGASYANSNNNDKAIVCYNTALKIRPNLARAWSNLGIAYWNSSDKTQCIVPFLNALSLNRDADHIWQYM